MKRPLKHGSRASKPRVFSLHAHFYLPNEDTFADAIAFRDFFFDAQQLYLSNQVSGKKRKSIIEQALGRSPDPIREQCSATSEGNDADRAYSKAIDKVLEGLTTIFDAAEKGDGGAVGDLADMAIMAAKMLEVAESLHPAEARSKAQGGCIWPMLISVSLDWEKAVKKRVQDLKLGGDVVQYFPSFRKARGNDGDYPARVWAKTAVETLQESKVRGMFIFSRLAEIKELIRTKRWIPADTPDWATRVGELPVFSRESVPEWAKAVREMIRQQMPDFHLRPEWSNQRASAKERGLNQKGEIQNAILDDICEALRTLAPATPPADQTAEIRDPK